MQAIIRAINPPGQKFRPMRYFFVFSLIAFAILVILIAVLSQQAAEAAFENIVTLRESQNAVLARAFAVALEHEILTLLQAAEQGSPFTADSPEIAQFHQRVLGLVADTTLLKVKVFDQKGLTVYSSEFSQVGQELYNNLVLQRILAGDVISNLSQRDTFYSFNGVVRNVSMVSSYVPIYEGGKIVGAFEVYDDVTQILNDITLSRGIATVVLLLLLTVFYLALFWIMWRVAKIMNEQYLVNEQAAQRIQRQNESLVTANREIALARRQAESVNVLKSQFIATMSHELRTPLNAVIGYTQLQLAGMAGTMTDKQREFQNRVLVNAQHLLHLINEILDLSKIEAGRLELIDKPFNLRQLIDEIVRQNQVLADKKGLTFVSEVDERLPETLVGDVGRIKQVVINLVSNAIKFTDEGTVSLRAALHEDDKWQISVSDTGLGIFSYHAGGYF